MREGSEDMRHTKQTGLTVEVGKRMTNPSKQTRMTVGDDRNRTRTSDEKQRHMEKRV